MAWRDWLSGRRRGGTGAAVRCGLRVAALAYGAAIYWRNRRFDRGGIVAERVAVPVISVGNLTVGGTGKTPMVAWLARWFRRHAIRVTLVSRGYGAEAGSCNDEALELEMQLPDVPHLQNPDRVAAARIAIEELDCQVLVLDDAFQHRRIHRDLDLVLIDALVPFGYGYLLPRGLLREPIQSLRRAQVVVLSRADLVDECAREVIRKEVARCAPQAAWVEVAHRPRGLLNARGESADISALRGQRIAAFCGLGNPEGFRRTLQSTGAQLVAFREYPDHFDYRSEDMAQLAAWADALDVDGVICTLKDFVKLRVDRIGRHALRALAIEMEVLHGDAELDSRLSEILLRVTAS
ncbi:MAG: tetraacyldisaccharide 4'-kinase [Pirellulaceae bacterium]